MDETGSPFDIKPSFCVSTRNPGARGARLYSKAEKEKKKRDKAMERAREDFEWVHRRRQREKEWHSWRRSWEVDMELCRRQRLASCFRAWRSLTPGYVTKALQRLLERAEASDTAKHKTRGGGAFGGGGSSSMLAAERRRLAAANERADATRWTSASAGSAANVASTLSVGWTVSGNAVDWESKVSNWGADYLDGDEGEDDKEEEKGGCAVNRTEEEEKVEEEEWDHGRQEWRRVTSTAELVRRSREVRTSAVWTTSAGGARSSRGKEKVFDIDFDFESDGPVAPTSTVRDLRAAAERKARGPRHSEEVIAAGRLSVGNWIAQSDSIMVWGWPFAKYCFYPTLV